MYNSEFYVPSHITGFFVPFFNKNILKTGSTGAGVSLSKGVRTKIKIKEGIESTNVILNGKKVSNNKVPVTLNCIKILNSRYPRYFKNKEIIIEHECHVPIEAGFGASAAAALGICFAVKDLIPITPEECIKIAHETEVISLSGLGDVVAIVKGGVEIRRTPGILGLLKNIELKEKLEVLALSLGSKKTENILNNPEKLKIIEEYGSRLLNNLIEEQTVEKLMECSREFTYKTEIMSKQVLDITDIISEVNTYNASGIMIGDGVFTFVNDKDKVKVLNTLKDIKGEVIISSIANSLL